jgi:hypothetical protein
MVHILLSEGTECVCLQIVPKYNKSHQLIETLKSHKEDVMRYEFIIDF